MTSERMRRQLERLLDEAEAAVSEQDWSRVAGAARAALAIEADHPDGRAYLRMAEANDARAEAVLAPTGGTPSSSPEAWSTTPESFAGGRYRVRRFLGEGGKKRVFLAHDTLLDRDVAFSLIKTEGLDAVGRERVMREARAMGRLTHPQIVSVFDIGEDLSPGSGQGNGQPYLVQELMAGGDVEGLLADAGGALPLARTLELAIDVCRGLEFAHAQGVVHRDLKPGNVWLTAGPSTGSGRAVAKIGDLGLAVQTGETRLTTHGMMVGTLHYMPPEQALGGEVTPRADLYSLGAMLYEMVTGRPPFEGDTPTAVISQHLNTPPVAPSWHSEHCPPDLEALILRLLEKDPARRPASAAEVRAALEAVDPEGRSRSHADPGANPLERLARGIFVGRERELETLRAALDAAITGRGSVVMLAGEPGIGKTRTVQELETYARMRGAEVYWGRTHESAGMPAYWPWLQVGRAWGAAHDVAALAGRSTGGLQNPELVRLFPELRQVVPSLPEPAPPPSDEAAQFLLFDAYTQFVRAQARETPWLVVLDDLHWADRPTLQLLRYLARELADMPVLVIGTYRDSELARTHPLSETLAELNRDAPFTRVVLKGLARDEVAGYLRQRAGVEPAPRMLDRIYEETEGNPFFLSEVVNLLTQEGTLTADSVSDLALPDGVREALGRRLDRLPEETNELLRTAAVVGREFAFDTLALLDDRDDDALLAALEGALAGRVIEELPEPGRYRFTHALMQETLLDELSATRRVRLHGRVADALERRWGDRADDRASRLARHFLEAAALSPAHAAKAARYATLAAEQARAQSAWAEAERWYGERLTLVETPGGELRSDEDEAELRLARGACARNAGDYREAWRELMRAIDRFRERGDGTGFAQAVIEAAQMFAPPDRVNSMVEEALSLLRGSATELEAALIGKLFGFPMFGLGPPAEVARLERRARQLVSSSNSGVLGADLAAFDAYSSLEKGDPDEADQKYEEAREGYERLGMFSMADTMVVLRWSGRWQQGALDEVLEGIRSILPSLSRSRAGHGAAIARYTLADIALIRCDFDQFETWNAEAGEPAFAFTREMNTAQRLEIAGALTEALQSLPAESAVGRSVLAVHLLAARARLLAERDGPDAARGESNRCAELIREFCVNASGTLNFSAEYAFSQLDEALLVLGDEGLITDAYAFLRQLGLRTSMHGATSLDRLRGNLSLRLDRVDDAERHFREGLEWCERERCPVEAGRCHQGLAAVAERHGDHALAMQHLDAAGELFSRHGAKLYLDQVLAKKEILKA